VHRNFFLFEHQARYLADKLTGSTILQVFTFRKNEIVLHFENPACYFHISIDLNHPYFLDGNVHKIRKPKFQLFEQLNGQKINSFIIIPFDKLLYIHTDDLRLEAFFFGKKPNIYLYDNNNLQIDFFKEKQSSEQLFPQRSLLDFRNVDANTLTGLINAEPNQKLNFFIKRHFYAINNTILNEISFRLNIPLDSCLKDFSKTQTERLAEVFDEIKRQIEDGKQYLYFVYDRLTTLSIFPLLHKSAMIESKVEVYDNLNRAWWKYVGIKQDKQKFERIYTQCSTGLNKRLKYIENSLQKLEQAADLHVKKEEAELKGNLLLTFKTQINSGQSEVELDNIFSDLGQKIKIKLNPAKSVVENASRYFEKFKNMDQKREVIQIKEATLLAELDKIKDMIGSLEKSNYLKVQKMHEQLSGMKILQSSTQNTSNKQSLEYAFKRLILDNEWDVFIGKNGQNNALLTFEFAHKWDIWLHAQGVPGSHVVLHLPRKDFHPPQKVVRQAAQIAAANSKAKFSTSVPVIYTEVRYVSRIRKALPGTVSVRNEQVLFVDPLHMN